MSTLSDLHLSNIQNQSKFAELYPPIILGLISSIILKNSIKPDFSSSSLEHSITLCKPLLVFIPIMKIRPSLGSREVVSKSNTNLVISLYSLYPLTNRFSFCIRYCSTGGKIVIKSFVFSPQGSRPPSLKNWINERYPLRDLTINFNPDSNLSSPLVSSFSTMIPYLDIASF